MKLKGLVALSVAWAMAGGLILGGASSALAQAMGEEKFKVGDKAKDFSTVDTDGKEVALFSYQGKKVVLLNFWGLRCGACIEEIPHLNDIADRYREKGLQVLGVNTDGVDAETIRSTMGDLGISTKYVILLDQEFTITDTYTNFLVPLTLVIGKDGTVRYIHTGFEKGLEKEYDKAVKEALGS